MKANWRFRKAAASARLCVETLQQRRLYNVIQAAASARLCVETVSITAFGIAVAAAASARLCVETGGIAKYKKVLNCSRLRAAVC